MEKITLPATQKGYFSQYFWGLFWFLMFIGTALWFSGYIDYIYKTLNIDSLKGFDELSYSTKNKYEMMYPFPFLHLGMFVSYFISASIVLVNLYTAIYGAREISTFAKGEDGYWGKLFNETYAFPFSKTTKQVVFDRIIGIEVKQSSVCRILNTGTLAVRMITFTNADSKEEKWSIPAIKKPYERKAEIEAFLLSHEGLKVKLLQGQERGQNS